MTDVMDANPRAVEGANNPPPLTPYEAHKLNIEGLWEEATNWLDGQPIENEGQATDVAKLRDMLREAENVADDSRKVEKEPHDDAIADIQGRYNPLIAPMTNKKPGLTARAYQACNVALTAWLKVQQDKRDAEAKVLREKEETEAQAARDALAAANKSADLGEREVAEQLIVQAQQTARAAVQMEKPASAQGFGNAVKLKDHFVVKGFVETVELEDGSTISGRTAAFRHFWSTNQLALVEAMLAIAAKDVARGVRTIPGMIIANEQRV